MLPFFFARRYLFAKGSSNAIHIISGISVLGIAIGTAALILVLSVFNGFEGLLSGLFGYFNPEIKITPAKGKTFVADSVLLERLRQTPGVALVSETLEEIAFFEYEGSQDFGVLKGVDAYYARINDIDSTLSAGRYVLQEDDRYYAVVGAGMSHKLRIRTEGNLFPLRVYMPRPNAGPMEQPFTVRYAYPAGIFSIQQEFDNQYILAHLDWVRDLLDAPEGAVSALEVRCQPGASTSAVKARLAQVLGEGFVLRDRYEQNEAFFKVMRLEKWMGFAILTLMLLLMAFNMVGALWMLVLDKQRDIATLRSLGADDRLIRRIFIGEGLLLTTLGLSIGIVLAVSLYAAHKRWNLIEMPVGFVVSSYPIEMRLSDFLPVTATVLTIGLLASLAPAARAVRVPAYWREE
ncbi:MAG: ABC transporter permease [Saprospiraceae bacterium]|nr:ABC transporter permease [Saprospiraceae bacterium]MDW8230829.1 ABC transporter permease [Saprospiraceae bacterium]